MGEPRGSPMPIGVPRFELGTSPTRTERATRLRHTPSAESVQRGPAVLRRPSFRQRTRHFPSTWRLSSIDVARGRLSSTSTSRSFGPGPSSVPRDTGAWARGTGSRSSPVATTLRERPRSRSCRAIASSYTTTRSGSRSPSTSSGAWAVTQTAPGSARRHGAGMGAARELLALRRRAPGARRASAASSEDRACHERPAGPRRVRRAPRLEVDAMVGSRLHGNIKPHPSIFESALADARRRARGGGDGRGLLRGRHRGRPRTRDAGDPARPRRPASGRAGAGSTRCSRYRRPSASRQGTVVLLRSELVGARHSVCSPSAGGGRREAPAERRCGLLERRDRADADVLARRTGRATRRAARVAKVAASSARAAAARLRTAARRARAGRAARRGARRTSARARRGSGAVRPRSRTSRSRRARRSGGAAAGRRPDGARRGRVSRGSSRP